MTDKACFNKIKMDYLLVLTLCTCWDIKSNQLTEDEKKLFKCISSYLKLEI